MSNRLTTLECDAACVALSFLLAGDTDGFEPQVIAAAERALEKLQTRLEAVQAKKNASAERPRRGRRQEAQ